MNARSPSCTPRRTCCSFLPCLCWGLPTPFLRDTPATLRAVRPCLCVPLPLRHMHTHPRTRHHQPGLRAETGQAPRHRPPTAQAAARVPSMASARGQPLPPSGPLPPRVLLQWRRPFCYRPGPGPVGSVPLSLILWLRSASPVLGPSRWGQSQEGPGSWGTCVKEKQPGPR